MKTQKAYWGANWLGSHSTTGQRWPIAWLHAFPRHCTHAHQHNLLLQHRHTHTHAHARTHTHTHTHTLLRYTLSNHRRRAAPRLKGLGAVYSQSFTGEVASLTPDFSWTGRLLGAWPLMAVDGWLFLSQTRLKGCGRR